MRVAWATEMNDIGNAYGFTHGNRWGKRCLEMAGVTIDPESPVAVHHCPPHAFRPIEGKFNVLWTAWEFAELPDWETKTLGQADVVCVTARFLVPVFKKYVRVPVRYVQQGIDTDAYFPKARSWARKYTARHPFRVLWVGAANDRKGYQFLLGAWRAFADRPDMQLVLKTTLTDRLENVGNVIFDSRNLAQDEMVKLYQSADCFAFPSMAEGFGFTLGEAMACGLPCIYTPCTSLPDIAGDAAIPIKYSTGEHFIMFSPDRGEQWRVEAAEPDATDLALKILWVKENRCDAERIGRAASARIRRLFTWDRAGNALRRVLESYCQTEAA